MSPMRTLVVALSVVFAVVFVRPEAAQVGNSQGTRWVLHVTSDDSSSDQRRSIALVERMIADGDLRLTSRKSDPLAPSHVHERLQQNYAGLPIIGADVAVQRRNGQVISIFGVVFDGLAVNVTPRLAAAGVMASLRANGFAAAQSTPGQMSILPGKDGSVSVVYGIRDDSGKLAYVDANTAAILFELNDYQTQAAVGTGTGVAGDSKKISTTLQSGTYVSLDGLRPPALETFDLRGNPSRLVAIANGVTAPAATDLATSATNVWTDGAVVDAHVYAGWVYDYYYKRFGRRGLDDNNVRIQSIVNPMRPQDFRTTPPSLQGLFINAFYSRGCRCMVYGPGVPAGLFAEFPNGVRNFAGALDVVAHELTHAVTDASSSLIYANESGALNEAFSDIMGTSVEFFHGVAGGPAADYTMGEDLASPPARLLMRSLSDPGEFNQPDHYWFRSYIGATRHFDSGGVHVNSGIANNAFYLAIQGGQHSSGVPVTGVGAQNREQIEKVFYRAFTSMLPTSATFYMARLATLQSARDQYGVNSAVERAVAAAWDAVGVSTPGAAVTTLFSPQVVPGGTASCGGGSRPTFTFRVSAAEFQRVGYTVEAFEIYTFDATGRQISRQQFTGATFRSWFSECQAGSTRIGPGSVACATLCGDLGGRTAGAALFTFSGFDDNMNYGFFNSDYVMFGRALFGTEPADTATATGAISYSKAVQ
jgi:bacillolysin